MAMTWNELVEDCVPLAIHLPSTKEGERRLLEGIWAFFTAEPNLEGAAYMREASAIKVEWKTIFVFECRCEAGHIFVRAVGRQITAYTFAELEDAKRGMARLMARYISNMERPLRELAEAQGMDYDSYYPEPTAQPEPETAEQALERVMAEKTSGLLGMLRALKDIPESERDYFIGNNVQSAVNGDLPGEVGNIFHARAEELDAKSKAA